MFEKGMKWEEKKKKEKKKHLLSIDTQEWASVGFHSISNRGIIGGRHLVQFVHSKDFSRRDDVMDGTGHSWRSCTFNAFGLLGMDGVRIGTTLS